MAQVAVPSTSTIGSQPAAHVAPQNALDELKLKLDSKSGQKLRVAIVTENFLPKVDGVTRTLARLLEHLRDEGHEALVLGPATTVTEYAGHKVVGTKGIPLLVYPDLKLNFFRPLFIRKLLEFKPDVIHFVDPIWLGAQTLPAVSHFLPDVGVVSSYHTNLAMYASLFGWGFLTPTMWRVQRYLHGRCSLTFCPSPSTAQMLGGQGFTNVRLWSRGVDTDLFNPGRRSNELRDSWGVGKPHHIPEAQAPVATAAALLGQTLLAPAQATVSKKAFRSTDSDEVVCLYVGRMSWEKNLRLLVEAFRGLEKPAVGRPACRLVFVGDGPAMADIQQLCDSYGLNAVFMGHRKGAELAAAFASADIFAFPSWTETFGQVVLESLASGLPVVGLQAEGVRDLVMDHASGRLLNLDDLNADSRSQFAIHELFNQNNPTFPLAVARYRSLIAELASDKSKREMMSQTALLSAGQRSWHGAMSRIVDGYQQVADAARERRERRAPQSSRKASVPPSPVPSSPLTAPLSRMGSFSSIRTFGSFASGLTSRSSLSLASPASMSSSTESSPMLSARRDTDDVPPIGLGIDEGRSTARAMRSYFPSRQASSVSSLDDENVQSIRNWHWDSAAQREVESSDDAESETELHEVNLLPSDLANRKILGLGSDYGARFWVIFYMLYTLFSWVFFKH